MPTFAATGGPGDMTGFVVGLLDGSNYVFTWLSLLNFASAAVIFATGSFVLWWERGSRVARYLAGFALMFALWQTGRGVMRNAIDPAVVVMLARIMYALVSLGVALLFQFVMIMLRREQARISFIRFNWLVGVAFAMASVATTRVVGRTVSMPWGLEPVHGVLGAGLILWICAMIAAVGADFHRAWTRSLPGTVERRRVGLFALAVLSLCTTIVDFLTASGVPVYPVGFATAGLFTIVTAYITRVHGLVEVTAQLAAGEIAAMTRGALLILDAEGTVRVVNDRIAETLGRMQAEMIGRPAQALLGEAFSAASVRALAQLEEERDKEIPYVHPRSGQTLDLTLAVNAVRDPRGREVAYVCVLRDVTAQRRAERERLLSGLNDALTGLPNRAMFLGLLEAAVERARKSPDYAFAVCFLGVNRMRVINEDLGYATGDRVLEEFAQRLRRAARPQDAVARIGGDEFGVLIRGHDGEADVRRYAERIYEALCEPLALEDHQLFLAANIGVAIGDGHASGAELLRRAGAAMYRAKAGAGVEYLAAADLTPQRTRLEAELRRALEQDELRMHYQPIIDLEQRRIDGFEALVRWQHPQRGLLLPKDFLDFAEEVGLAVDIDRLALRHACMDIASLRERHGARCSVSVNLSEATLLAPDIIGYVQEQLADARLPAEALRVEVLERVAQIGRVHETLERLRRLGVGLYIDDFGTGYSALSRLHQMPVSTLKIDREFVRAMALHAGAQKLIGGIVALAVSLSLEVIAEGCAVAEEVRRVHQLGCRFVQGFAFAPALPLDEASQLLGDPALLRQRFDLILPSERRRLAAP